MNDDMTGFERRFETRLARYASIPVAFVDARAVARAAAAARRSRWHSLDLPRIAPAYLLILIGLLLALAAAAFASTLLRDDAGPIGRNGLIAYVDEASSRIHLMNPDGTGDHELTDGLAPAFSSNGRWLTHFTGIDFADLRIIRANADGHDPIDATGVQLISSRRLAGISLGYSFAPDATRLVIRVADEDQAIDAGHWLVDVNGGSRRMLLPPPSPASQLWHDALAWSPDSRFIAYAVMQQVASGFDRVGLNVVDVETGFIRELSTRPGSDRVAISWSPDGRFLAFTAFPEDTSPSVRPRDATDSPVLPEDVFVVRVDGTDEHNVTNSPGYDAAPLWSPDGSSLAYRTFAETTRHVAIINLEGTHAFGDVRFGPSADEHVWSPDGTMLLLSRTVEIEPTADNVPQFRSTLQTIDPSFKYPPTPIGTRDFIVGSLSWQWLEP